MKWIGDGIESEDLVKFKRHFVEVVTRKVCD